MNNSFEFGSKKVLIVMTIIFLGFFMLIFKAFDYLPQSEVSEQQSVSQPVVEGTESSQTTDEEASVNDKTVSGALNIKLQNPDEIELKPIEGVKNEAVEVLETGEENSKSLTEQEEVELRFFKAKQFKENKQYVKAIEEYTALADTLTEASSKARCYEEIAGVYGIMKRYGTALSYAQKAYNLSPSSSREMQLARLYYKTGDIDKATSRINNILQRDFVYDK